MPELTAIGVQHRFEIFRGSVMGYRHFRTGTNNQDADEVREIDKYFAAMVSDGVSRHSDGQPMRTDFGARAVVNIGLRSLASALKTDVAPGRPLVNRVLKYTSESLLEAVERFAHTKRMGKRAKFKFVDHYFAATAIAMLIGPKMTYFYWLGDGLYSVNDRTTILRAHVPGQPDTMAQVLEEVFHCGRTKIRFGLHAMPTAEIENATIGTDGMESWFERCKKERKRKPVKWLLQAVCQSRKSVSEALHGMNYIQKSRFVMESTGLFGDDATFVTARRYNAA